MSYAKTGTIASQDANAVALTGGTINGTTVGITTPAAAQFTNVTLYNATTYPVLTHQSDDTTPSTIQETLYKGRNDSNALVQYGRDVVVATSDVAFSESGARYFTVRSLGVEKYIISMGEGGGSYAGLTDGNIPLAGTLGEQVSAFLAEGSAVSLASSGSFYTVISLDIDAGIWDISALCKITQSGSGTANACSAGIATATNSNTGWTQGDNAYDSAPPLFNKYGTGIVIPSYRVVLSSLTTYYLTAGANFASGTYAASGRISAVRVG